MAKIIKFPLKMADGFGARTIEELREHADVSSIAAYYDNGKLHRWLLANYLDDNAKEIDAIKESLKNEYNKIDTLKIQKIYKSLGIIKLDDQQLYEYLTNKKIEESFQDSLYEVENDPSLREEVKKNLHKDIKIEDWNIACSETKNPDFKQIFLENKKDDLFLSFKIEQNNLFYKRIASFLCNSINSLTSSKELSDDSVKEEISIIFLNSVKSVVFFANKKWSIQRHNADEALLLCCSPISQSNAEGISSILDDFYINNFTSQERKALVSLNTSSLFNKSSLEESPRRVVNNNNSLKVFLMSKRLVSELLSQQDRQFGNNWWLSDGFVRGGGGMRDNFTSQDKFDVVPAIIISRTAYFSNTFFV